MRGAVLYGPRDVRFEERDAPLADGTVVATPDLPPHDLIPSLLTLSDSDEQYQNNRSVTNVTHDDSGNAEHDEGDRARSFRRS
jgi:hypothetical protein